MCDPVFTSSYASAVEMSTLCHAEVRKLDHGLVLRIFASGMETCLRRLTILPVVPAVSTPEARAVLKDPPA